MEKYSEETGLPKPAECDELDAALEKTLAKNDTLVDDALTGPVQEKTKQDASKPKKKGLLRRVREISLLTNLL
jgi:hypothetical protein